MAPPSREGQWLGAVVLQLVCILEFRENTDVQDPCQRHSLHWFGVQPVFMFLPRHGH